MLSPSEIVQINQKVDEVYDIQKFLIGKYSKYSLLPLSFDVVFPRDLYDVYKEKMENINEYIKNEDYISKIESDLNSLGMALGDNVHIQVKDIGLAKTGAAVNTSFRYVQALTHSSPGISAASSCSR